MGVVGREKAATKVGNARLGHYTSAAAFGCTVPLEQPPKYGKSLAEADGQSEDRWCELFYLLFTSVWGLRP